jgi:hypothetical protein
VTTWLFFEDLMAVKHQQAARTSPQDFLEVVSAVFLLDTEIMLPVAIPRVPLQVAQQDFQLLRHKSIVDLLELSKQVDHCAASAAPGHTGSTTLR